jgi:hypothetical protein
MKTPNREAVLTLVGRSARSLAVGTQLQTAHSLMRGTDVPVGVSDEEPLSFGPD